MALLLNNRFEIWEDMNKVVDRLNEIQTKIEPRLMHLLLILIENQGKTVPRELLAEKVWDNYPGSGDGINQAVSYLRKLLDDKDKQLIQTLPKRGYCLRGQISDGGSQRSDIGSLQKKHTAFLISACCICLLVIACILWLRNPQPPTKSAAEKKLQSHIALSKSDSLHQAKQLETAK